MRALGFTTALMILVASPARGQSDAAFDDTRLEKRVLHRGFERPLERIQPVASHRQLADQTHDDSHELVRCRIMEIHRSLTLRDAAKLLITHIRSRHLVPSRVGHLKP